MKEYKIIVTLERTLVIEDDMEIEKEVVSPLEALSLANSALNKVNIRLPKLDMKDWNMTDIKYKNLNENT